MTVGWERNLGEGKEEDEGILEWKNRLENCCNMKEMEEEREER